MWRIQQLYIDVASAHRFTKQRSICLRTCLRHMIERVLIMWLFWLLLVGYRCQ
jgi:hypothetical protein